MENKNCSLIIVAKDLNGPEKRNEQVNLERRKRKICREKVII